MPTARPVGDVIKAKGVHGVGMPIEANGQMVAAIGVSGAPGGDNDDICAKAG